MRNRLITIFVLFFCLSLPVSRFGQNPRGKKPFLVGADNNESSKANLDLLAERAGKDKSIIFISRLGILERSRTLSRKRLQTVLEYLINTRDLSAERLVPAFGDRASREGRIEVYLDNDLFMIFLFKRNRGFEREP
jgi:hypothetical protein